VGPRTLTSTLVLVLAALLPGAAMAQLNGFERPRVEVAFVLDTTGSMGGLIQGAKQKIWSIVNEIAQGQPAPEIKVGLVGYRDRGDAYVTTVTDLTHDIDTVFAKLMAFQAGGGGDGPEHVNAALREAVHSLSWSQDRETLKVIFLVGDAPPHMDYANDVPYPDSCQHAVRREIIINAVQCGSMPQTRKVWQDIAHRSEGRFVALPQSGGTVALTTPFDAHLAALSGRLDRTFLTYGEAEEQLAARRAVSRATGLAKQAAAEAAAARASYRGSRSAIGSNDLLADLASGAVTLDALDASRLPEELRDKTPAERIGYVAFLQRARQQLKGQIADLSEMRRAHIEAELKRRGGGADSFDVEVIESIRAKAAERGISYGAR